MVFRTILTLLLAHMAPAMGSWVLRPASECDFKHRLVTGEVLTVNNPYWPSTYRAGDTCRWTFDSPYGYTCHLKCSFVGLPESHNCYMDSLLVSTTGNRNLKGATAYCGQSIIDAKSSGTRIALGLKTSRVSPGGRFTCVVLSEPELHPDMMETSYVDLHRKRRLEFEPKTTPVQDSNFNNADDDDFPESTVRPHTYLVRPLGVKVLKSPNDDPGYVSSEEEVSVTTKSLPSIYGMSLKQIKAMAEDQDDTDNAPFKKALFPVRRRTGLKHHNFKRVPMYRRMEDEQPTPPDESDMDTTHYTRPLGVKILESMGDNPIHIDYPQDY